MHIGSDLDDTLFTFAPLFIQRIEQWCNTYRNYEDLKDYDVTKYYNISTPMIAQCAYEVGCNNLKVKDNAINIINKFIPRITFISNRDTTLYGQTLKAIDTLGITSEWELYFGSDKASIINDLGIELFIEDRASNIISIHEKTNCDILMYDQPWNQKIKCNSRITRVFDWFDIQRFIKIKELL